MKDVGLQTDAELRFNRKDLIEAIKCAAELAQGYDERSPKRRKLSQYLDEQHDVLREMRHRGLDTTKLPQTRMNPGEGEAEVEARDLIRFFTQTLIPDLKESDAESGYILDFQTIVKVLRAQLAGKTTAAIDKIIQKSGFKGHNVRSFAQDYLIDTIGSDTEEAGMEGTAKDLYNSADVILILSRR